MDSGAFPEAGPGDMRDSAIDFSLKKVSLEGTECPQESGATQRANSSDPMKLWYTVNTDPRTAKKIALESLSYASIDQSVYIMLQVDCPFPDKFEYVNIQDLVHTNLRNGMTLMELSDCLRLLAKYAKELLKPSRERYKNWNKIPFLKSGSPQKWTRMEGTAPILHRLGYTQGTSKGYVFPLTSYGPPMALIKVIALELAMSAAELSVFYNNRHPKSEVISAMLYARSSEPTPTEHDTAPCSTSRVFNVMDLLGSSVKTDKSQQEQESKSMFMYSSPHMNATNGVENPPKRRRSYEDPKAPSPSVSSPDAETQRLLSQTPAREATLDDAEQLAFDHARRLEVSNSYAHVEHVEERDVSNYFENAVSTEMPNLAPRYLPRVPPDSPASEDAVRRFQAMMPPTLPNLSILGNMLSNTNQKYFDNF